MPYLTLVPYFILLAGVGSSYVGMLPAMKGWMLSALGVLSGLGLAIAAIFVGWSDLLWTTAFSVLPATIAIPMVINDLRYP